MTKIRWIRAMAALMSAGCAAAATTQGQNKPRARDLGIPFDGTPGPNNAITDVGNIEVGYTTLISGDGARVVGQGPVRTGVTAILPRGKGTFEPVFAAIYAGNGNGEMTGSHWINESGLLETPITITNTLSVGVVRDAVIEWMVKHNASGPFWYPLTAETSDGALNDMKGQHVRKEHVFEALESAHGGAIAEGNVGGGTGMNCNGFKGGVGTASRKLAASDGGYMLGVLVQCNTGSRTDARIAGYPVGREIVGYEPCVAQRLDPPQRDGLGRLIPLCTADEGRHASTSTGTSHRLVDAGAYSGIPRRKEEPEQGSIIVVVATDAPLTPDELHRLVRRVELGLGRIGSINANGSGDIFVAFSTANGGVDEGNSRPAGQAPTPSKPPAVARLASSDMNPLFEATAQAVEEAVVNAMIAAETMTGADYQRRYAIPHDQVQAILRKHGLLVGATSGG